MQRLGCDGNLLTKQEVSRSIISSPCSHPFFSDLPCAGAPQCSNSYSELKKSASLHHTRDGGLWFSLFTGSLDHAFTGHRGPCCGILMRMSRRNLVIGEFPRRSCAGEKPRDLIKRQESITGLEPFLFHPLLPVLPRMI